MNIKAINNFIIIKAAEKPASDKPFEVVDTTNYLSEVVSSAYKDFKAGDIIVAGPPVFNYNLDGTDYVVIRADEVMGTVDV